MLSTKVQNDLITAYQKVYEEKRGHAAGSDDTEKQASQLASDVRYKAKSKVPDGASKEEKRKIFLQILASSPAPNVVKAMAKEKLLGEEVVSEDKKMGRQSDDDLKKALDKLSKMDQSSPANSFMKKRIEKEMKKRKTVKEGSSYGITRGSGKPSGPMAAFGKKDDEEKKEKKEKKAPRRQKGAMAYDGPNKERSEAADRVLAKTKAKRKKMKEEYVTEVMAKMASAAKKMAITDAQKKALKAKISLTKGQKEVLGGRTTLGKAVRIGAGAGALIATGRSMEAGAQRKRDKEKKIKLGSPNYSTSDKYSSYNLKLGHTPEGELIDEKKLVHGDYGNFVSGQKTSKNTEKPMTPQQRYKIPEGMDPVGKEDGDINNDGKKDSTDSYLMKRRKAIGKAIAKKRGKVKEGFSAWRIDLDFNEQVKK